LSKMGKIYDLDEKRRKAGDRAKGAPLSPGKTQPKDSLKQPSPELRQMIRERLLLREHLNWLRELRSIVEEVKGKR